MATARTKTEAASERAGGGIAERLNIPYMDGWLMLAALGLIGFSIFTLATATTQDVEGQPLYFVVRQSAYAIVGLILLFGVAGMDYSRFRELRVGVYTAMIVAITFVLIFGAAARGSRRRIELPYFGFQPSEFGKVLFVLFLAAFLAERGRRIREAKVIVATVALAAAPALLVFLQPDIGTALVYGAALAAVLFVAGTRWWHLAALALAVVVASMTILWWLPAGGVEVLKPYQTQRLTGFAHPSSDPRGTTYNVTQSITSVGSGGLRGRGVSGATQTTLNYLPEHGTDFAFASLAEQRGFLGASLLLLLYLLIVWRGLKIITVARDAFSAIAAGGIVIAFLFQIFVNVGMTIGIAPITGIPLPFVSVGGSSMISNLLAVGVLEAIHARGAVGRRTLPRPAR